MKLILYILSSKHGFIIFNKILPFYNFYIMTENNHSLEDLTDDFTSVST